MSTNRFPKVEVVKDPELQFSFAYKITKPYRLPFYVPVIDVRDGQVQRKLANSLIKNSNARRGSRYIPVNYSSFLQRVEKDLTVNDLKEDGSNQ